MDFTPEISRVAYAGKPADMVRSWPVDRKLVMIASGRLHPRWARWTILAEPVGWFRATKEKSVLIGLEDVVENGRLRDDPLTDLELVLDNTFIKDRVDFPIPFTGGWIGGFSYELGKVIEPTACFAKSKKTERGWPLIELAWCPNAFVYDHSKNEWWSVGNVAELLGSLIEDVKSIETESYSGEIKSSLSEKHYHNAIDRTLHYIAAGDIYQANITQRLSCAFKGSSRALWLSAIESSKAWYGAYIESSADRCLLSISPELFLEVSGKSGNVITRPIKGTRPSSVHPELLFESEKDAAELNMIVDLMRNDLGRVCEFGSVRVNQHRTIETHPTVHHGVAEIAGRLGKEKSLVDLLRATFPAGSVTGAPKIRAMQIIDELEPVTRGPYCGSYGFIDCMGNATLNVAIRTISLTGKRRTGRYDLFEDGILDYGTGGGIVADSVPTEEFEESIHKTRVFHQALENLKLSELQTI